MLQDSGVCRDALLKKPDRVSVAVVQVRGPEVMGEVHSRIGNECLEMVLG